MKRTIYILLFLSSIISLSQENIDTFIGEVHVVHKTVFNDEAAFNQSAELFLKFSDSIVKKDYLNNPNSKNNSQYSDLEDRLTSNRIANMIGLNYKTGDDLHRPKPRRWIFSKSLIRMYKRHTNSHYELDRKSATYLNYFRYKPNNKREPAKYTFFKSPYKKLIVYKEDIKKFAGISCFKVVITYVDRRLKEIGDSEQETIYEMYVTDKLLSKYNPISADLNIIEKYFPMYVKSYRTGFKGRYFESEIVLLSDYTNDNEEELKVSFEKFGDSLFREYKELIALKKRKEKKLYLVPEKVEKSPVPFQHQLRVLESLGYKFNPRTSLKRFETELIQNGIIDTTVTNMEAYFTKKPYDELYFFMGWWIADKENKTSIPFNENIIWHDLGNFGVDAQYINFMERMGAISDDELTFSDIQVTVDEENYQWISFKVNNVQKKWKLEKVNYVDESFISRFVYLTEEFKTNGKYTHFDIGGESFLIDYVTPDQQKVFIEKTGIKREWLTPGKHFRKPNEQ